MLIRMKKESVVKNRKDIIEALTDKGYEVKDMSGPMCGILGVMGDICDMDIAEIEGSEGVEIVSAIKGSAGKSHRTCPLNTPEPMRMRVFPAAE